MEKDKLAMRGIVNCVSKLMLYMLFMVTYIMGIMIFVLQVLNHSRHISGV